MNNLVYIAREAGRLIVEGFHTHDITTKDDGTPVTNVDIAINDMVVRFLQDRYPEISVVGEEGSATKVSRWNARFDPLDGTKAYTWQMPMATFCIAILVDREPRLTVAHDPFSGMFFSADTGMGARMFEWDANAPHEMHVSKHDVLKGANICLFHGGGSSPNTWRLHESLGSAGATTCYVPSMVYTALRVPMGLMHGSVSRGCQDWETASLELLVTEAGGVATDLEGNKLVYGPEGEINGHILACTPELHEALLQKVRELPN